LFLLVTPARLERATYCLEGSCSIQLSYGIEVKTKGAALLPHPDVYGKYLDRPYRARILLGPGGQLTKNLGLFGGVELHFAAKLVG
jgi:hypothetical protein